MTNKHHTFLLSVAATCSAAVLVVLLQASHGPGSLLGALSPTGREALEFTDRGEVRANVDTYVHCTIGGGTLARSTPSGRVMAYKFTKTNTELLGFLIRGAFEWSGPIYYSEAFGADVPRETTLTSIDAGETYYIFSYDNPMYFDCSQGLVAGVRPGSGGGKIPLYCPPADCDNPPERCVYSGVTTDANGCRTCGELLCVPDESGFRPNASEPPNCPAVACERQQAPDGCRYVTDDTLNANGCPANPCGTLLCVPNESGFRPNASNPPNCPTVQCDSPRNTQDCTHFSDDTDADQNGCPDNPCGHWACA